MNNIEDELAIRNLMATYVDAANRRDGELWKSTWAEEGVWRIMGMDICGRDNIHQLWLQVLESFDFALLMPSSGQFTVDGDSAHGHWYLQELTRSTNGDASTMIARYTDKYTRREGQWYYALREYILLYAGDSDLSGEYTPVPTAPTGSPE